MTDYQLTESWRGTAESYQDFILPLVSRTFALTIPQLPAPLGRVVANAYLLCRVADTIEDDVALSAADKRRYAEAFVDVVNGRAEAAPLAEELGPLLSLETIAAERNLVRQLPLVIEILRSFRPAQRGAVERCVAIMCRGMHRFQQNAGVQGLGTLRDMDRYCYYVAGVVGEMLTDLFCDFDPAIAARREAMTQLATSFGQALQMTNILKDQWEDRARGACWLPREVFERHGVDLAGLQAGSYTPAYGAALTELVGVAHAHLRNALSYTLEIPAQHTGIRRFCLWALGLAVLTLKNIHRKPEFTSGNEIKVSRAAVARTIMVCNVAAKRDALLHRMFDFAWRDLPLTPLAGSWQAGESGAGGWSPSPQLALAGAAAAFDGGPAAAPAESNRLEFRGSVRQVAGLARPASLRAPAPLRPTPELATPPLDRAVDRAREALMALQREDGHWCFEFETDCTISAEYILMMHFIDEIDDVLQEKLARYIRSKQRVDTHGGWPLYQDGAIDLSCTVKSYYALKAAGDSADAPHMRRAREVILSLGGAAKSNVFTRILLAMFEQVPWRAAPYVPVEIMLFPKWAPFHLDKVSYWARATMVPLFILCSLKAKARNPRGVHVRELFVTPPEEERHYFSSEGFVNKLFQVLDNVGRACDPLIPKSLRARAIRKAEQWFLPRLNGEDGLGAIFPPMVNALEAMDLLGYPKDHPARATCLKSLQKLVVQRADGTAFCQPCVSPVWDTGWSAMALLRAADDQRTRDAVTRALQWLVPLQELELKGDWAVNAPDLAPGGWAFQYANGYYPDLDDTAMVAGLMHVARKGEYNERIERAADWLVGMQSDNGGFAAFDRNNTCYYINHIPFADHGAMLDPPTEDVSGRVLACLGVLKRDKDREAIRRCVDYLKQAQLPDGSFWGRWGTNYVYGTWSVLAGLALVGEDLKQPWIRKSIDWLKSKQHADGGWGETNDSYEYPQLRGSNGGVSTSHSTAWALLGLLAAGEHRSDTVRRGIDWLVANQGDNGLWQNPSYNAPGFPRVFYLKYHGYDAYFPLWALTRYRQLMARNA
ncbi:MAG: squalene--hopene cyclase [Nevskia sp.]|nr:squalene--hopene cyclase [Nevskia sp.]